MRILFAPEAPMRLELDVELGQPLFAIVGGRSFGRSGNRAGRRRARDGRNHIVRARG
jgi:hypothetical protein